MLIELDRYVADAVMTRYQADIIRAALAERLNIIIAGGTGTGKTTLAMGRLLKSTLRQRPDRIIVGEVRDGAALTLLKAWNTGHPGGIATVHANSARAALTRLEQLVAEVSLQPMPEVIGEAVDLIISIERTPGGRKVREILRVEDYGNGSYRAAPATLSHPEIAQGKLHVV